MNPANKVSPIKRTLFPALLVVTVLAGMVLSASSVPVYSSGEITDVKDARNGPKSVGGGRRVSVTEPAQQAETAGVPSTGERGIQRTMSEIMRAQTDAPLSNSTLLRVEREMFGREKLARNPEARSVASTLDTGMASRPHAMTFPTEPPLFPNAPQTVGTNFTGATLADTNGVPPDTMGAVGPSQFLVFINERIRTFNKTTGVADGVMNVDPDVFFAAVKTTPNAQEIVSTFAPQVRYDRLSGRWIMLCIDVPRHIITGDYRPNRLLIAVSDAASAGVISGSTVWTLFQFQPGGSTNEFTDYPSLGIDNNALYVGANMFSTPAGSFNNASAFVIRKSSILGGGPIVFTAFLGIANGSTEGPYSPRGVDNYDPAATEGYFIGISILDFGRLVLRRVSDPGGTPSISANELITVSQTANPLPVPHLGNTGGNNGRLAAGDDRLWDAHIRNGRLWTSHNIAVDATGVANPASGSPERRNGVRWYELIVPVGSGTPTVNQSGTIFDTVPTASNPRHYWIPSVTVSGQGHVAFGFSVAGLADNPSAGTNGRLASDPLGTTGAVVIYAAAGGAYNPSFDPGGTNGRRWGDYSFTSLDPLDDMTMWTIQEYCDAPNSFGVRVAKLQAPPPATPSSITTADSNTVPQGQSNYTITLTGIQVSGSGFYDPGANLAAPALPFNHINVTINGAGAPSVNSIAFVNPTTLTVTVNSTAAATGSYTVTVTNPDGQTATSASPILTVAAPSAPVANDDAYITAEDMALTVVAPGVLGNDTPASPLTASIVTQPAHGTVTLNSDGSFTYTPASNYNGTDSFTYKANNGTGDSNTATVTITINAVNDAPVNSVPGPQTTNGNTPLTFSAASSNLISISDIDAASSPVQVTLTATSGTVTLSGTTGLAFTTGDGTADATMTFTGSISSINTALNGLTFTPTANFSGAASLQITSNDQGNTGAGGPLTDSDTISITVNQSTIQFDSANYTAGETDGHANITVTRLGVTTAAASVEYLTSDVSGLTNCNVVTGNASARCDYTAVGGTVNFAAGQSSATFAVPIINDVYTEGSETLTITLSNSTGGTLGSQSTATLTINDNDLAPGAANPIGDATFFIRQLYLDILNREPDPPGLAGWQSFLATCPAGSIACDRIELASRFFRSDEFFARAYFVYRFYDTALGRKPTYDEYQKDLRKVAGFLTNAELEARKAAFAEEFSQRPEFKAKYDSKTDGDPYVNAIVATAGVVPSNRTSVAIRQGALVITRGQALRELLESPEISARFFNEAFVVIGYFAYLRREPDAQYLVFLNTLNTTGDYREMIRNFIESQEYRARFGP